MPRPAVQFVSVFGYSEAARVRMGTGRRFQQQAAQVVPAPDT